MTARLRLRSRLSHTLAAFSAAGPPLPRSQDMRRRLDGHAADGHAVDLDAYVAKLLDDAPSHTSEQRDTLALILRRLRHA